MDPVEPGEWIVGRPRQLVFLTGLDPTNKPHHRNVTKAFEGNQSADRPPLQIRVVSGELDIPQKKEKGLEKGILRREWFQKYLNDVPALIAVFIDLDWNSPSWEEKKTEAESKVASIRASLRHATKVALIMIQQRPTHENDNLAAERAHELSHICSLTSKHLFVLPIQGDVDKYVVKLENAFHEICQGFYQQKLKTIRSRSIPNNSPALVVRQQFKLAFISEMRQDTHTALRNYRLAYDQCKDSQEQWEGVDVFEWRSVAGLLNYKMCELCFLHSTALEAITQMRKHQQVFFSSAPGIYPTPQLASIEYLLWKAKQCYHFAKLFEQAVNNGLSALATLNPGTHLDQAASIFSAANTEIAALKRNSPSNIPYPSPDPLENTSTTTFFGQRPWRVGREGLATAEIESSAVTAIIQRLVINYGGVIQLYEAGMKQYKKYRCLRMFKKILIEVANTHYTNNDIPAALEMWGLVTRDTSLPATVREDMMHRATWASYAIASIKDFVSCCLQMMCPIYAESLPSQCSKALEEVLMGQIPSSPFPNDDVSKNQLEAYQRQWQHVLAEHPEFVILAARIEPFIDIHVSFLNQPSATKMVIMIELTSKIEHVLRLSDVILQCKSSAPDSEDVLFDALHIGSVDISSSKPVKRVLLLDTQSSKGNAIVTVKKVILEMGSVVRGRVEYDENTLSKSVRVEKDPGSEFGKTENSSVDVKLDKDVTVECLIGEVAGTELVLRNPAQTACRNLRMEFKRSEQQFTEAAAVLFVDQSGTELKSEYSLNICDVLDGNQTITIPLKLSAQLVGTYSLQLELGYEAEENGEVKGTTRILNLEVVAKEPFLVTTTVMNMNGTPMSSILNNCEHILNVNIRSAAAIVISSVEFLLADVVTQCDVSRKSSESPTDSRIQVHDGVEEGEEVCYSTAIRVLVNEDETEIPLGRMCVEWKRSLPNSNLVRSVVPLCRIPVLACPISIISCKETCPVTVRQPVEICFELISHSKEALEISVNYELNDVFMFHGERKVTLTVLPGKTRRFTVCVMALSAGRLNFPKISLKSSQIPDGLLQQALRTLPATIFVLPKPKSVSPTQMLN